MVQLVVNLGVHRLSQVAVRVAEPNTVLPVHDQVLGLVVVHPVQLVGQGRGTTVGIEAHQAATSALRAIKDTGGGDGQAGGAVGPTAEVGHHAGGRVETQYPVVGRVKGGGKLGKQQGLPVPDRAVGGAAVRPGNRFKIPTHWQPLKVR